MKKALSVILALIMMLAVSVSISGCGQQAEDPQVKCENGIFVGTAEESGVLSFKGIPYAKQPVGDLRWKAPEAPDASDETFDAKEYGNTSIQYEWHSEPASYNEIGEDCLSLNVWTKDTETKGKPVMFYIHGGGFSWGGTADPLYSGEPLVQENEDIVVVTCNYRVGAMGCIDLTGVEGGEEYPDSRYLCVLDLMQGLKWVKENIEGFGGDPENITIFGESAGGAFVSILMATPAAEGLFQHAIAQSGSLNLTFSAEDFKEAGQTEALMEKTGAQNMDDLMALSEEELIEAYTTYDEEGNCINDITNMPLRGDGSVIPEDPYKSLEDGTNMDVDFMTGTNADEWRYWINEMGEVEMSEMDEDGIAENLAIYEDYCMQEKWDIASSVCTEDELADLNKFLEVTGEEEKVWQYTELANETAFRIPSIDTAYAHAKAGGNTYMYYFEKKSDNFDFIGACHASELAYVFHNIEETIFSGTVDESLADSMNHCWTAFARTGNPSADGIEWTRYTTEGRETMIIGDDCSMTMKNDPLSEQRVLIEPFVKYYLK